MGVRANALRPYDGVWKNYSFRTVRETVPHIGCMTLPKLHLWECDASSKHAVGTFVAKTGRKLCLRPGPKAVERMRD